MRRNFKLATTMVAAVALLAAVGPAYAADASLQSLQDQINALQAQLKEMQAKQAAAAAAPAPAAATPSRTSYDTLMTDPSRGAFVIPGTNTTLHVGGFVDLSATYDVNSTPGPAGYLQLGGFNTKGFQGNSLTAQNKSLIALPGTPAAKAIGRFQIDPRFTRVNIETDTPTSLGVVGSVVEMDFDGDGLAASERVTYSVSPRLRRAFLTVGNWTIGQTQQLTYDAQTYATSIDNNSFAGYESGNRYPQVSYRYDLNPEKTSQLYFSVEAPFSDVVGADGGNFVAGGQQALQEDAVTHVPDFSAKFVQTGSWGRAFIAGTVRNVEINTDGTAKAYGNNAAQVVHDNSWGGFVDAGAKIFTPTGDTRNNVTLAAQWGNAAGRSTQYNNGNVSAVIDNTGHIQFEPIAGVGASYQHWFNNNFQSNVIFGENHQWNKLSYQANQGLWKDAREFEFNTFWMPTTYLNFGLAYIWSQVSAVQGFCLLSTSAVQSNGGATCSGARIAGATRDWSGSAAIDNRFVFRSRLNF